MRVWVQALGVSGQALGFRIRSSAYSRCQKVGTWL